MAMSCVTNKKTEIFQLTFLPSSDKKQKKYSSLELDNVFLIGLSVFVCLSVGAYPTALN